MSVPSSRASSAPEALGTVFDRGSPYIGRRVVRISEGQALEYLVTMTTNVPDGTSEAAVQDIRTREAARSRELAAQGHLLRLWRPPLRPGEWRTLGLFAADDGAELERVLASMPLRVWRTDEVTPLSPHPNDPARQTEKPGAPGPEAGAASS
jgi:muconolactone D-isomerase